MTNDIYAQGRDGALPTPRECLQHALRELTSDPELVDPMIANMWIELAREIRQGSTAPLIDRAMDRLTLHDVEGIVCSHGRVAVRRKNSDKGRWFVHTDDGSNCAEADEVNEHRRRRSASAHQVEEARARAAETLLGRRDQGEDYGTTLAGEPTYRLRHGAEPRSYLDEVSRSRPAMDIPGDRIIDYHRGQAAPPSKLAVRYAEDLRAALNEGKPIPLAPGAYLAPEDLTDLRSLVDEILRKAAIEAELTATQPQLVRPHIMRPGDPLPAAEVQPEPDPAPEPECGNCGARIRWVEMQLNDGGPWEGYIHTLTGQAACVRPLGQAHSEPTYATPRITG